MSEMPIAAKRGGIPRGIATEGPAILSYGFRPFFLGAGVFAVLAMGLWLGALIEGWPIGGAHLGAIYWHAHEMLFGYTTAALAGFMLTAIPNWTGRLPVSGPPLAGLALLWLAGRIGMGAPEAFGLYPAIVVDALFLPVLAAIAAREIIAGRNWKNLKVLGALVVLSGLNIGVHVTLLMGDDPTWLFRGAISIYVLLIALVGGRIVPSFTRNWLARQRVTRLPRPFGLWDKAALAGSVVALAAWIVLPQADATGVLCLVAALLQLVRLAGWRGYLTLSEPLVAVLHAAYLFIPIGLVALALAVWEVLPEVAALHLFTVGVVGGMTMAVMTRATRGHTGRPLAASMTTSIAYLAVIAAALARPLADLLPDYTTTILAVSASAWVLAFLLFTIEHGPMLIGPKRQ